MKYHDAWCDVHRSVRWRDNDYCETVAIWKATHLWEPGFVPCHLVHVVMTFYEAVDGPGEYLDSLSGDATDA